MGTESDVERMCLKARTPPRPDAETEGEIIYIHPKGRFFTVRMKFERGSYCESFACNGREGEFEEYREIKKGK